MRDDTANRSETTLEENFARDDVGPDVWGGFASGVFRQFSFIN